MRIAVPTFALFAVLAGGCGSGVAGSVTEPARRSAQIEWNGQGADFGGLSGLLMAPDGMSLIAVSDKGLLIEADLIRHADGRLTGVRETARHRLTAPDATVLFDKDADAESLAMLGDDLLISLERRNAIWRYDAIGAVPMDVAVPEGIATLQTNSGIEALTTTAEGAILAIPERSGALERPFPIYRLHDGVWDTDLSIPRESPFLPTDADVGPDGRLYVLERHFTGFSFRVQVRSFAMDTAPMDGQLSDMRYDVPPVSDLDNAEGLDVWRDAQGQLRLTMISDDNFMFLQRTLITEYVLVPGD